MILGKTLIGVGLALGFAALPLSAAQAYPCNPVTGVFGAAATVAGAAVTIGTAPLVILSGHEPRFGDYTCGDHPVYRTRYYEPEVTYDGPPEDQDAPYYDRPHRPSWYWNHRYESAPPPPPPPDE